MVTQPVQITEQPGASFRLSTGRPLAATNPPAHFAKTSFLVMCLILGMWLVQAAVARAQEPWSEALARMPLPSSTRELNWSNCVPEILHSFQSNGLVKAIIFMPGATDELYTFRRVSCSLPNQATVADAVRGITKQGLLDARFQAPFLLIHTRSDLFEPEIKIENPSTLEQLRRPGRVSHLLFFDKDWDAVQPVLKKWLKLDLRPWRGSDASWHFYRHSLAAWNLSGWEAVQAIAFAGKTRATIRKGSILFEPDTRPREGGRVNSGLPAR